MQFYDCDINTPEPLLSLGFALRRLLFWCRVSELAFAMLCSVLVVFEGITTLKECSLAETGERLDNLRLSERNYMSLS